MSFSNGLTGCSEIPVVENAEVAESSKRPQYSDGDTLDYSCVLGYVSQRKIIFKCSNNEWTKVRGDKCSRGYTRHTHAHTIYKSLDCCKIFFKSNWMHLK